MDKIQKALNKLSDKEKAKVKLILKKLFSNNLKNLNIKKLKGRSDIYRVRQGDIRIIYRLEGGKKVFILIIERRSDKTYNF